MGVTSSGGSGGDGRGQLVEHRLDAGAGVVVGAVGIARAGVDAGDDLDGAAQVVEDDDRVGQGEAGLGQPELVGHAGWAAARTSGRRRSPASPPPRRRSGAARAGPRPAAARTNAPSAAKGSASSRRSATMKSAPSGRRISTVLAAGPEHGAGAHPQEAVGGPLLAADHALEQEGIGPAAQAGEGGHRGQRVGQLLAVHEGQPASVQEVEEALSIGHEAAHGRREIIFPAARGASASVASAMHWREPSSGPGSARPTAA